MSIILKTILLNIFINNTFSSYPTVTDVQIDYNKTKEIVQSCLNDLLNTLQINVNTKRNPKLHVLVVMHNNLNNVIQYKWKVHSDMKNKAKVENITVPSKIYEFVEAVTSETQNLSSIKESIVTHNMNITEHTTNFYAEFLNRINNLPITIGKLHNISLDNDVNIYKAKLKINNQRRNNDLQTWEPNDHFDNNTRRLSGGKAVGISQYPFIVSIHVQGKFSCTGCIISKSFVITAASCLHPTTQYNPDESRIKIRISSDHSTSGGDLLPAAKVIFHPQYISATLEHNLAMIKMTDIIHSPNRPAIKKIRVDGLPEKIPKNFANKDVLILGWSENQTGTKKRKQHLASAFLNILSLDDCIDIYTKHYVSPKHFCAGSAYEETGACIGDIGAPAIVLGTLVGLVSFGPTTCDTATSPTVFTKLEYYTSWIQRVLNKDTPQTVFKSDPILTLLEAASDYTSTENTHEDMVILRQLLHDEDNAKNILAENIEKDKDPDVELDNLFQSTAGYVDAAHHELVNKSVINVPGLHIPTVTTEPPYTTLQMTAPLDDIGLPDNVPYDLVDTLVESSNELRYYVHNILTKGTLFKASNNMHVYNLKDTDPYDNFEYDEGLSIEAPNNYNINIQRDTRERHKKQSKHGKPKQYDLDNNQHNIYIDVPAEKTTKDIWLDVRLLQKKQLSRLSDFRRGNPDENVSKRLRSISVYTLPRKT